MERANVDDAEFEYDADDPDGYRAGLARVGQIAGGQALKRQALRAAAGTEPLLVSLRIQRGVAGSARRQRGATNTTGEERLKRGALVCFAPGPEGAHKFTNRGEHPAHVLMFSSAREPAVVVYPDSDKIGVWPGNDADRLMLRRADGHVEYFDGET